MARIPFSSLLAAMLIVGSWHAGAADQEAPPSELRQWYAQAAAAMESRAHELAARGDARSKQAAVHLLVFPNQPNGGGGPDQKLVALRDQWFSEAVAQSPEEPLLAWIQASCSLLITRESCEENRDAGLDRLAEVAGDRAVTHLMLAQRAGTAGDADTERAHFYAAASAPRFGAFDQEHLALIISAHEGLELPPATADVRSQLAEQFHIPAEPTPRRIVAAFAASQVGVMTLPAFQYPMQQCGMSGDTRERSDERHQACVRLFERMAEDSHNILQDRIALTGMILLLADSEGALPWRERMRESTWLFDRFLDDPVQGELDGSSHMESWVTHGESEAIRRMLAARGISDVPPAGWLPEHPEHRHLIEHGQRLPR